MKFTTNGMQHTTSTTMVFQTDDYKLFNMIKGNRHLDMVKIKKILADIERGTNLLKYCPILVIEKNKKLDIIDGQHRFMVAKKVKSPVYYIMAESLSLYDIARMNSNTEKWKAKDFINCYVELGNQNYSKLQTLMATFPGIPVTTATTLLSRGTPHNTGHHQLLEKFHRGEFVVTFEKEANNFLSTVAQFDCPYKFSREFLMAIHRIIEANLYPVGDLIKKVNQDPDQLKKQADWRKYAAALEEFVSKGKHKRITIY